MIGADITAALPELRAQAESLMTDTVHVTRPGEVTYDDLGTPTSADVDVYTGPGLVEAVLSRSGSAVDSGGRPVRVVDHTVKLPLSVDVRVGDRVTVTASLSAPNVGRTVAVLDVPSRAHMVQWRCPADPV